MALVQQHLGATRHRGDHARLARGTPDGADPLMPETDIADRKRRLGGRHEAVAPHRHRSGPGVRRLAGEHHEVALDPESTEHRGRGLTLALEDRPLLDVALDVRARPAQPRARLARTVELHVIAADHVLQALSVAVA